MRDKLVLAGIVTYNPDLERLKSNVGAIYNQVSSVIIIDNGSKRIEGICLLKKQYDNLIIIQNEINMGVAFALNQIGDYANDNEYSYFLTLDQDSISDKNIVTELLNCFQDKCVGVACPYIDRFDDFVQSEEISEIPTCITSGSLMDTKIWVQVGGFWEYLFIDEVDHEYCYHIRENGFKILQTHAVSINHIIGEPSKKRVLGHDFHPTNHSAFRRYYITRNCLLMKLLYPKEIYPFKKRYSMIFRIFVSTMLCEEDKYRKVKAMLQGTKDAFGWYRKNKTISNRRNNKEI